MDITIMKFALKAETTVADFSKSNDAFAMDEKIRRVVSLSVAMRRRVNRNGGLTSLATIRDEYQSRRNCL